MITIILIVFFVSGIVGLKKPLIGTIAGCILTIVLFFLFYNFTVFQFLLTCLIGFATSFAGSRAFSWFFSGFRGGKHNTGPSYIGGGDRTAWGGGIILTAEERENLKKKKNSGGIR